MMNDWLSKVGKATVAHREQRAAEFDRKAFKRLSMARLAGLSEFTASEQARWHTSRARGQRERMKRVEECETELLVIACQVCGVAHEIPRRCGCALLCLRCRRVRALNLQQRFVRARNVTIANARVRGLLKYYQKGGRWGERFLTLTAPHVPTDTIAERIERVLNAWQYFIRAFQAWQRERGIKSIEWLRVFEWTPGDDERGHPHLHIWIFSQFLAREMLHKWWVEALHHEGCVAESVIIDIREVNDPHAVPSELIKYLTKDIDAQGNKISPTAYGEVYCALDGRRTLQASRGFMRLAELYATSCECGATLPRLVRRKLKIVGESCAACEDSPAP